MSEPHYWLLAQAGTAPDDWLAAARDALARDAVDELDALYADLDINPGKDAQVPDFTAGPAGLGPIDRAVIAAAGKQPVTACWRTLRGGIDAVYLVQVEPDADPVAVTAALQDAASRTGEVTPRIEVFGPLTPLPPYHTHALAASTVLWTATELTPVRVARTFDSADPHSGPSFAVTRELVFDADERQHLLDYLSGADVVLAIAGTLPDVLAGSRRRVPLDLRSDGHWVWSDAAVYYLDRHNVSPDPDLAAHIAGRRSCVPLSHLDHQRVTDALYSTAGQEGRLWRAG